MVRCHFISTDVELKRFGNSDATNRRDKRFLHFGFTYKADATVQFEVSPDWSQIESTASTVSRRR